MCIGNHSKSSPVDGEQGLSRRDVLRLAMVAAGAGIATTLLGTSALQAADEYSEADRGSRTYWARLKYQCAGGADWSAHPSGDVAAIRQIRRVTDINMYPNWNVVNIQDLEKMVKYPFIFLHGQQPANLSEGDQKNLTEYMKRGGFLFIDDCVLDPYDNRNSDLLYQSMTVYLKGMLPSAKWELLDNKHEVFHNFYDLTNGIPHMQGVDNGLTAVYHEDRVVAMLCSSDIHCGWVGFFGKGPQLESLKMIVNIYTYAMTH